MMDKFSQFLSEKFLYDQTVAMELLIHCGLKEQLFDLAKVCVCIGIFKYFLVYPLVSLALMMIPMLAVMWSHDLITWFSLIT